MTVTRGDGRGSGGGRVPDGGRVSIGFKTSPQGVDWATLEATWAAAGELAVFDSAWANDHLTDPGVDRGGSSMEALTMVAALVHHVPGRWIGHAVLSNTFRHPAVLAKAATTLDHATGGRFILGLGAGWHEDEHAAYGIDLPPIGERISRLESAVRAIRALHSPEAATDAGVTLDDPWYPLRGAVNLPAPRTPGGPPIWLGGQGRRGLRMAAHLADGWSLPAIPTTDVGAFAERRATILHELDAIGRDPAAFTFATQVPAGSDDPSWAAARTAAIEYVEAGATHVILGLRASLGPDGLRAVAREVAEPLREAFG
jgi:alkanesulfonate monooxygenase SsuD/methylene tetrahydromethanopterin reductase-like flavin-dependent oxidoreductase (luciferase family)